MEHTPLVELKKIRKAFGSVKANDGVDLAAHDGEIHAILGENGSGKSTLMNVLCGLYAPDEGEILVNGKPTVFRSPKDAMKSGIGMIHQHFKLVDALCAWENIVGGTGGRIFLNRKRIIADIRTLCETYHFQLEPEKKVRRMTIGEKQTVEIVKALYRGARLLILDEPTAVLTEQEAERLFEILREMKARGNAVILITHKLQEVMAVSDRVTVLRAGKSVDSGLTKNYTPEKLAELMVGHEIDLALPYTRMPKERQKPMLVIRNLHLTGKDGGTKLDVDALDVHTCEILGIAGVADSGQRELCEAITGIEKASGSIRLNGVELNGLNPVSMAKRNIRIGYVPEDRLGMGLAVGMSISDNVALRDYRSARGLLLDRRSAEEAASRLIRDYGVSTPGTGEAIQRLSGGNIQKVLLGREIGRGAELLIVAYPVRGLDIGASDFIFGKLNEEKQRGTAVLMIGEDLDALLGVCDRIAVLHNGKLMGVVDAKRTTKERLGLMMMGQMQEAAYAAN